MDVCLGGMYSIYDFLICPFMLLALISVCLVTYLILKFGTLFFCFLCYIFQFGVKIEVTIFNYFQICIGYLGWV